MKSPWIDQKSARASASLGDSVGWVSRLTLKFSTEIFASYKIMLLSLGGRNGSLREKGRLAWRNAEAVRTNLLDAIFDCPKQVSPPSAFWSSVSKSALDLTSALGIWTSSTNRLFLVEIITSDVRCLPLCGRIAISSPYWTRIFTIWTSTTGPKVVPINVPPRIEGLLEKTCFLCIMEWSAQNRRPRQI